MWWRIFVGALFVLLSQAEQQKKNIVFLLGESFRPDVFLDYGASTITEEIAPNLNKLFKKKGSIIIQQAHTSYPLCNPSRTSMLLGRSPKTTGIFTNFQKWKNQPNSHLWTSLPRFLKHHGWYTMCGGKVFHRETNDYSAWDNIYDHHEDINGKDCINDRTSKLFSIQPTSAFIPNAVGCKTDQSNIPDVLTTANGLKALKKYAKKQMKLPLASRKPFFFAIGLSIPHTPIRVNSEYVLNNRDMTPDYNNPPRNASQFPEHYSFLTPKPVKSNQIPGGNIKDPFRAEIPTPLTGTPFEPESQLMTYFRPSFRRLFDSGAHQTDALFGSILDELDALDLSHNTLILFTSDHSFALGDTRLWGKDMPLDVDTRVPFVFHVPWSNITSSYVTSPSLFVETLDIYRTISGFVGLADKVEVGVEGRDLSSYLLLNQEIGNMTQGAVSFSARCSNIFVCNGGNLKGFDRIGISLRTKEYRFTLWMKAIQGSVIWSDSSILFMELYSHATDNMTIFNQPATLQQVEVDNIISTADPALIEKLKKQIQERFWNN